MVLSPCEWKHVLFLGGQRAFHPFPPPSQGRQRVLIYTTQQQNHVDWLLGINSICLATATWNFDSRWRQKPILECFTIQNYCALVSSPSESRTTWRRRPPPSPFPAVDFCAPPKNTWWFQIFYDEDKSVQPRLNQKDQGFPTLLLLFRSGGWPTVAKRSPAPSRGPSGVAPCATIAKAKRRSIKLLLSPRWMQRRTRSSRRTSSRRGLPLRKRFSHLSPLPSKPSLLACTGLLFYFLCLWLAHSNSWNHTWHARLLHGPAS